MITLQMILYYNADILKEIEQVVPQGYFLDYAVDYNNKKGANFYIGFKPLGYDWMSHIATPNEWSWQYDVDKNCKILTETATFMRA